jgi:hypothetical protein
MAPGGFLRIEPLGGVLRADVAFKLHVEKWKALLEQRDVIDAQIAAHGVDENELALAPGAVLDALLPLGGGKLGNLGVDLVGRGLGSGSRRTRQRSTSRKNENRQ